MTTAPRRDFLEKYRPGAAQIGNQEGVVLTNDGRLLWNSLSRAPSEALVSAIAFHDEVSIGNAALSKLQDVVDGDDHLRRRVERKAAELGGLSRADAALGVIGRLCEIAGVEERALLCRRDLEDVCDEIVNSAIRLRRQQNEAFAGSSLSDLIRDVTDELCRKAEKSIKVGGSDADAIVDQISEFVRRLPDEQREEFRRSLGVDQLTHEALRTAAIQGSLAGALAAAVNIGGFAFYTGAVSALAAVAGLVGITLPFGVYVGLTSTIAVITNPLFLLAVLGGGGWFMIAKGNSTIREGLVPFIVFQLCVAGASENACSDLATGEVLTAWSVADRRVDDLVEQLNAAEAETARLEVERNELLLRRAGLSEKRQNAIDVGETIRRNVADQARVNADSLADGSWGRAAIPHGVTLRQLLTELARADAKERPQGVFALFDKGVRYLDRRKLENRIFAECMAAVEAMTREWQQGHREIASGLQEHMESLDSVRVELGQLEAEISRLGAGIDRCSREYTACRRVERRLGEQLSAAKEQYWGLEACK